MFKFITSMYRMYACMYVNNFLKQKLFVTEIMFSNFRKMYLFGNLKIFLKENDWSYICKNYSNFFINILMEFKICINYKN